MQIEHVSIDAVQPHPRNARQGDVGAIVQSIRANGVYRPLIVQRSTGYILAGNHTWRALRETGHDEAPVVYVDADDEQAVRILLADNRSSDLGAYDDVALAELLVELATSTERALAGTGYDAQDLDRLLDDLSRPFDASNLGKVDRYAEWQGMPEYEQESLRSHDRVIVHFPSEEDAVAFFAMVNRPRARVMWWPENDGHVGSDRSRQWVIDE